MASFLIFLHIGAGCSTFPAHKFELIFMCGTVAKASQGLFPLPFSIRVF